MTGNDNTDNDSNETLISRRAVIATLGAGTVGVGVAARTGLIELGTDGSSLTGEKPPMNESASDPSTPSGPTGTPWDRDEVIVSIELESEASGGGNSLDDYGRAETRNAVDWWNDYIAENEDYDLTLTFDENPGNADILFQLMSGATCGGEYLTPVRDNGDLSRSLCTETLTETPEDGDLPFTVPIAKSGSGRAVFRTLAKHGIGRNLGYDIWSDPVAVMTPKLLFKPNWQLDSETFGHWLQVPSSLSRRHLPHLIDLAGDTAQRLRGFTESTNEINIRDSVEATRRDFTSWNDEFHARMEDNWKPMIEEAGVPLYVEAYEETILNEEIAYIEETVSLCEDILDSDGNPYGTDDFDELTNRIETISEWTIDVPLDLRIHRYFTETHWTAWENGTGEYAE